MTADQGVDLALLGLAARTVGGVDLVVLQPHPNFLRGGLKEGYVKMSAYGPAVSDAAKKAADATKAKMMAGTCDIFKGPLKDNKGKEVIPAGKSLKQTDMTLEGMNYLVEGVVGSI